MSDEIAFNPYYGVFPYRDFIKSEGIPLYEGYAVDCHTVPVEPWERLGGLGTYVHVTGKGDYQSAYVVEIPAGGHLNPEQHMHDELIHVISGRGATTIEGPDGKKHTFEWGPSAIFAIPMNAKHQIFNGSGTEPARLCAVTDLPIILNIFHDPNFIYDNPYTFPARSSVERYFQGEGEFREVKPGRHQWETVFVPDLINFQLPPWHARGAAGNNTQFLLADSSMHCHISEFQQGTYKKAHAHNAGAHIFCVTGEGYSLLWQDGENPVDTVRVDWKPGTMYAPPDGPTIHQHFNVANGPSRYLVFDFGGARYPVLETKMWTYENMDNSAKNGGMQIEYEDEDPRILELYENELAKRGLGSKMREFIKNR
jgi:quercetin dioxygenase-like cupin family protein